MAALDLVKLSRLMKITSGKPEIVVGLIDGPVLMSHPDLAAERIRELPGGSSACARADSAACVHGTYVAGVLSAKRGFAAPAICPDCTLLPRRIFTETTLGKDNMPSATPEELATAILDCIQAGAWVINLSVGLAHVSSKGERQLDEALNHAAIRGVLAIAAAGNQGTIGSSALTRHPWVIPVVACDSGGRPMRESNLGSSIGRRGLRAPGDSVTSLGTGGQPLTLGGTSVAAPFVTGAVALLWSEFPTAAAVEIKQAITQTYSPRRATIVPPLLETEQAYQVMLTARNTR